MNKVNVFIKSFFIFSFLCGSVFADEIKDNKKESTNAFMRFIDKYVLPE